MVTFRYPLLAGYEVATYIQPAREVDGKPTPDLAVFLFITDNPHTPGSKVTSNAVCRLSDWRDVEYEHLHYVGVPDPVKQFVLALARKHNEAIQSLKDLID